MLDDLTQELKNNIYDEKVQLVVSKYLYHILGSISLIILLTGIYLWQKNNIEKHNAKFTSVFLQSKNIKDQQKKIDLLKKILLQKSNLDNLVKMDLAHTYNKSYEAQKIYQEIISENTKNIWYELALINHYIHDENMKEKMADLVYDNANYLHRFASLIVATNDAQSKDKMCQEILLEVAKSPTEKLSQLSKQVIGVLYAQ